MALQQFTWKDLCSILEAFGTIVLAISVFFTWRTYKKDLKENKRQAQEREKQCGLERKQREIESYHAIDVFYFQILRLALDFPYLRSEEFIEQWDSGGPDLNRADPDRAARYNAYAFIVWNFLETIYDRCDKKSEDCMLWITWVPILKQERLLHLAWFKRLENRRNFKEEFARAADRRFQIHPPHANCPVPEAIGL